MNDLSWVGSMATAPLKTVRVYAKVGILTEPSPDEYDVGALN